MRSSMTHFNFTYRYIDTILSINNPDFANYIGQMYTTELEIKDMTSVALPSTLNVIISTSYKTGSVPW